MRGSGGGRVRFFFCVCLWSTHVGVCDISSKASPSHLLLLVSMFAGAKEQQKKEQQRKEGVSCVTA